MEAVDAHLSFMANLLLRKVKFKFSPNLFAITEL